MNHEQPSKRARVLLAGLAASCFVLATVADLVDHRLLPAIFTGLAAASFVLLAILTARQRAADQTHPADSS